MKGIKCRVCGKSIVLKYGFEVMMAGFRKPICLDCERKEHEEHQKWMAEADRLIDEIGKS